GHKVMADLGFFPYRGSSLTLEMVLDALSGAGFRIKVKESKKEKPFTPRYSQGLTEYLEDIGLQRLEDPYRKTSHTESV
ncbi:MAG: hypothetical protein RTU30_07000, partial [Candidatus Thorarchaeota archaeon]